MTKWLCGTHHEKGWYSTPFSVAPGAILSKILQDHSFPIPHPSAKFCPNPSSFWGDTSENVVQTCYNIGTVGFSPTMMWHFRLIITDPWVTEDECITYWCCPSVCPMPSHNLRKKSLKAYRYTNKQGSFVTGVFSEALAAARDLSPEVTHEAANDTN